MTKALVVVESPSKAKTINKYLGADFKVLASVGHVKDLPKKGIGIDFDNNFEPTYEVIPGKEKVIRELKAAAKDATTIYIATDPDREREIQSFITTEYWTITANVAAKLPPHFDARLLRIEDKTVKTTDFNPSSPDAAVADYGVKKNEVHIRQESQAKELVADINRQRFVVSSVATKEKKRNPVPPFITSKLQQEASRKLRFPVKKTMQLAQRLYEGIEIGAEGTVGLITYMRTDSTRVADTAISEVREHIGNQYGAPYLPEKPIFYRSKKDAQDAHEAIRPTSAMRTPDQMASYLGKDELALYKLIWQRFVAPQMMPAIFDQTTIDIKAGERYLFRATGSVVKFNGFLAVYEEGKDEKDEEDEEAEHKLPKVEQGEELKLKKLDPEQHFTEPPPRFTEATLVKALEEKGIGRPSTYASIMTVIQDREYVERKEGRFVPTELGFIVNDLLVSSFDDLFNVEYTAHMEEELDEIEEGKMQWTAALAEFYEKFTKDLAAAKEHMRDVKRQEIITDEICEN